MLVKKVSSEEVINVPHKNECRVLLSIRNKYCPFIAKYYVPKTPVPFEGGEIFMDHYQVNLADSQLKEGMKLRVMHDVAMALYFMVYNGLVHRDMKELNVMLGGGFRGQLIDFGSTTRFNNNASFQPVDRRVRSTEGYYVPYKKLVSLVPSLEMREEDYYSHPNFDVYSLGVMFKNEFFLSHIVGESHFLRNHLRFLSEKCTEINPDKRWSLFQVILYLRQVVEFMVMEGRYWQAQGINLRGLSSGFGGLQLKGPKETVGSYESMRASEKGE